MIAKIKGFFTLVSNKPLVTSNELSIRLRSCQLSQKTCETELTSLEKKILEWGKRISKIEQSVGFKNPKPALKEIYTEIGDFLKQDDEIWMKDYQAIEKRNKRWLEGQYEYPRIINNPHWVRDEQTENETSTRWKKWKCLFFYRSKLNNGSLSISQSKSKKVFIVEINTPSTLNTQDFKNLTEAINYAEEMMIKDNKEEMEKQKIEQNYNKIE